MSSLGSEGTNRLFEYVAQMTEIFSSFPILSVPLLLFPMVSWQRKRNRVCFSTQNAATSQKYESVSILIGSTDLTVFSSFLKQWLYRHVKGLLKAQSTVPSCVSHLEDGCKVLQKVVYSLYKHQCMTLFIPQPGFMCPGIKERKYECFSLTTISSDLLGKYLFPLPTFLSLTDLEVLVRKRKVLLPGETNIPLN